GQGHRIGMALTAGWKVAEEPVEGDRAGAAEDDEKGDGDGEQVVFKAFAFLGAGPVHEEAVWRVDDADGDDHVDGDGECGESGGEAEDERDAAGEFGHDGGEGKGRGNVHDVREKSHGSGEAIAAEEAEGFLGA